MRNPTPDAQSPIPTARRGSQTWCFHRTQRQSRPHPLTNSPAAHGSFCLLLTVTDRDLSPDRAGYSPRNSRGLSLPFNSTERSSPSRVRSRRACWHALDRSGPFHPIIWYKGKTATDRRSQCDIAGGKDRGPLHLTKHKPSLAGRLNGLFERIAVEEAAIGPSTTTLAAEVDAIISDYPAALIAYLKGKGLR